MNCHCELHWNVSKGGKDTKPATAWLSRKVVINNLDTHWRTAERRGSFLCPESGNIPQQEAPLTAKSQKEFPLRLYLYMSVVQSSIRMKASQGQRPYPFRLSLQHFPLCLTHSQHFINVCGIHGFSLLVIAKYKDWKDSFVLKYFIAWWDRK